MKDMRKKQLKDFFADFGFNIIIKYKYLILLLLFGLTILGFLGMQKLEFDSSNDAFLPENDPVVIKNDKFKEIFGNDEFVFILVESDEIFSHNVLQYIKELTEDLEDNLPFVDEVTSLANLDYIETEGDRLIIDDLIKEIVPTEQETLNDLKNKILAKKTYVGKIITEDCQKTGIIVTFQEIPEIIYAPVGKNFSPLDQADYSPQEVLMDENLYTKHQLGLNKVADPRKLIAPALKVILARHSDSKIKTTATGVPVLDYETDRMVTEEGTKFGLIALLAATLLMIVLFRSFRAVAAIFLVVLSSLVILFGTLGWLKLKLSILALIIPTLVLVISVSYSIHVINHFLNGLEKGSRYKAIKYAYRESTWPILITALTTALGFISFIFVPLEPIKIVGFSCAVGTFLTYLIVMIVVPLIFSIGKSRTLPKKDYSKKSDQKIFRQAMEKWADFVVRNIRVTVGLSIIVVIFVVFYSFKMPINSDMLQVLGKDVDFVKNANYITERLGALYSYDVLLEFPEEGMVKKSEVLKEIDGLTDMINRFDSTVTQTSIIDLIKELHMTMNNNQETFYQIPASNDLLAQYLLLYEISGGEDLEDLVDFNYQKTHISVQVNDFKSSILQEFEKVITYGQQHFPSGTKVTVVGDMPILLKTLTKLVDGQKLSIFIALMVITLVMIIVLKSIKLGLLSMIPNVIPVLVITGLMGLLQYSLDFITVLIAPMIIGIAVDDTVHYFLHFKEEYLVTGSYHQANKETFRKIGKALISACVVLMLGFAIFVLSRMASLGHMAVLSAAGIFAALAADMLITPAIVMLVKPFGENLKITNREEENYEM
ncbi:MAG: hypothetical protein FH762_14400 [Firmicutes bacterium]|nr:hypothetical protein [Bacillota bacterium]